MATSSREMWMIRDAVAAILMLTVPTTMVDVKFFLMYPQENAPKPVTIINQHIAWDLHMAKLPWLDLLWYHLSTTASLVLVGWFLTTHAVVRSRVLRGIIAWRMLGIVAALLYGDLPWPYVRFHGINALCHVLAFYCPLPYHGCSLIELSTIYVIEP